jgi:hypothetical protein
MQRGKTRTLELMPNAPHMFEQEIRISRPLRVLLAAVLIFGVVFFGGVGALMVAVGPSQHNPVGVTVVGLICLAIALPFGFLAWRLIRMRQSTDYLLGPDFTARWTRTIANAAGPTMMIIGLSCAAVTAAVEPSNEMLALGLFLTVSGVWVTWKKWRRR